MLHVKSIAATVLFLVMTSRVDAADSKEFFFGVATIDRNGTICLRLLSRENGAPDAHGYFCYEKSSPEYRRILAHVGPIEVGEEKRIAPFK